MNKAQQHLRPVIALLGGTFDPIHFGHTLPAQETALWLGAEQLHLIPAHIPPHKAGTHASAQQRADMVALVCNNNPIFSLDSRELKRNQASFTLDTLHELNAEHQAVDFYFIMGMDSLLSFTSWHKWQEILSLCNIVVNIRPGYSHQALTEQLPQTLSQRLVDDLSQLKAQRCGQIILHECQAVDISSTEIRAKIKAGLPYRHYLPDAVYHYIEQHKLYR
ncbi:nicotinate-nucleotide adenylyltransferase [Colwellia chukchiensis]|uniref:Probable nicotinate-nucleotide adenylyltransferase n=1 Tax=Colwellia chukchiensis TaxID=641665 RepID=A0A1H7H473_9GAMM|nr:nicotinate-nucleotide adenylyltransferase [Colwellia chukchiensis]SEK44557.1 nicotinate-nucleotide adenylyltransferase [Colwellia chukchiensis]